jgi:hypothetical protein
VRPERFLPAAIEAAARLSNRGIHRMLLPLGTEVLLETNEAARTARIGKAGSDVMRIEVAPSFLARHVRSDRDALFLLLHELMHRVRGDFHRHPETAEVSPEALNLALDLFVDAALLRLAFREPPGMLRDLYPADRFPWNLLLPPTLMARACRRHDERWRAYDRPHDELVRVFAARNVARWRLAALVEEQFRRSGAPDPPRLTQLYLPGWLADVSCSLWIDAAAPFLSKEFPSLRERLSRVVLLGDHDSTETIGGRWDGLLRGHSGGGPAPAERESLGHVETAEDRGFFEAVRRAVCRDARQPVSRPGSVPAAAVVGDVGRREAFFLADGLAPPFHRSTASGQAESHERVHVYLDVSGSTTHWQRLFFGLTLRLGDRIGCPVYQFSNEVVEVTPAELRDGLLETTGGTDFDCVIRHALEHDFARILVVTDGFASLDAELRARAESRGLRIFVVLTSEFHDRSPIVEAAQAWWVLPERLRTRRLSTTM